jgi:hypothetical protein
LSYRPARLYRLAEWIPWDRFLGSLKIPALFPSRTVDISLEDDVTVFLLCVLFPSWLQYTKRETLSIGYGFSGKVSAI